MKKFIYIILLTFVSALTITSCTEEAVAPKTQADNNGGAADNPIIK
jgi:hypothetical protein